MTLSAFAVQEAMVVRDAYHLKLTLEKEGNPPGAVGELVAM